MKNADGYMLLFGILCLLVWFYMMASLLETKTLTGENVTSTPCNKCCCRTVIDPT